MSHFEVTMQRIAQLEQRFGTSKPAAASAPESTAADFEALLQRASLSTPSSTPSATTALRGSGSSKVAPSSKQFAAIIEQSASKYGVPSDMIRSVIQQESAFNPLATSSVGAQGLMQLMPGTASDLGVGDSFNPAENIDGGTKYLRQQYDTFGSWKNALAAYNAGPGNVSKYGGVPPFGETQNYVRQVMDRLEATTAYAGAAKQALQSLPNSEVL